MAELTWSAAELAKELGVSEWLIRRNLDHIPHLRIGQRVVFPKVAIRRWLEEEPLALRILARADDQQTHRPLGTAAEAGQPVRDDHQPRESAGS
jgi:hypothetical protein